MGKNKTLLIINLKLLTLYTYKIINRVFSLNIKIDNGIMAKKER